MKHFWSQLRLHTQIAIVSAGLLAVTIFCATIINIQQQKAHLIEDILSHGLALSRSLSSTISYNLIMNQYDAIEEILLKSAEYPEVRSLKVVATNGLVLSQVEKTNSGNTRVLYQAVYEIVPEQLKKTQDTTSIFRKNLLSIWYPLKTSSHIGWLNVNMSLAELKARRSNIIIDNIVGATIAIVFDVLFLLLVLIKPTRKIHRAIEVAKQLDTLTPSMIQESGGSSELNKLFAALNDAAKKLTAQHREIENQTNELKKNNISLAHSKNDLLLAKEQFDRAIDGANDGLWDFDIQNSEVWCSSQLNAMLGNQYANTNIPINKFISYFHPEDRTAIDAILNSHNLPERLLDERCRIKVSDKNYIWFRIRGRVYNNSSGKLTHIAGSIMDISEQVRIEVMKDEFVATVSHELRTPLTSIKGALSLINGEVLCKVDSRISTMLDIAARNTERLLAIVNDILDISKIEAGTEPHNLEALDLVCFASANIELNQGMADEYQVTLEFNTEIEKARIDTDQRRLNQIMTNLLSNAIKFSSRGGKVIINLSPFQNGYRLAITDNGPGIDIAYQPFLYNKFTQEQSTLTRNTGGTGLGLAITKGLVEKLKYKLSYITSPNTGTTFFVDLRIPCTDEKNHLKATG